MVPPVRSGLCSLLYIHGRAVLPARSGEACLAVAGCHVALSDISRVGHSQGAGNETTRTGDCYRQVREQCDPLRRHEDRPKLALVERVTTASKWKREVTGVASPEASGERGGCFVAHPTTRPAEELPNGKLVHLVRVR